MLLALYLIIHLRYDSFYDFQCLGHVDLLLPILLHDIIDSKSELFWN